MVTPVELRSGLAQAVLAPELGGGIARLDVDGRAVLRPWKGDDTNTFSLGCNVLVPFSNRISKGGFSWAGNHYTVEPNLEGEALPIHGDGFQKPWTVSKDKTIAEMKLVDGAIGPWQYHAVQNIQLLQGSMEIELVVTNTGSHSLPFGCGFHPWFPRNSGTRISFDAKKIWMENAQFLPTKEVALSAVPQWDFRSESPLPAGWINNAFSGWRGVAHIFQNEDAVSCMVEASANLNTAIVFSPSQNADFFCFEPVSHPVDAVHLPGSPGMKELAPQQSMNAKMKISWSVK